MYHFPDAAMGLARLLDGLQTRDGLTITTYTRLQSDFTNHLPAVHILRQGGDVSGVIRRDRVGVSVYAIGESSQDVAEEIQAAIADRDHYVEGIGLLDRVSVAAAPVDVDYPSSEVTQCVASYFVDTRPLPEQ